MTNRPLVIPSPRLVTQRLLLRPVTLADAPAIQAQFPKWEIVQHLSNKVPWPYPDDGAMEFLTRFLAGQAEGTRTAWGLVPKEQPEGGLIGVINLFANKPAAGDRGFWLAMPYWGQGYMTEAANAVTDYAFRYLGWDDMNITNVVENARSGRVKERQGFTAEGELDGFESISGPVRLAKWNMTREAWLARTSLPAYEVEG